MIGSFRRVLCLGIYRSLDLCQTVKDDVTSLTKAEIVTALKQFIAICDDTTTPDAEAQQSMRWAVDAYLCPLLEEVTQAKEVDWTGYAAVKVTEQDCCLGIEEYQ